MANEFGDTHAIKPDEAARIDGIAREHGFGLSAPPVGGSNLRYFFPNSPSRVATEDEQNALLRDLAKAGFCYWEERTVQYSPGDDCPACRSPNGVPVVIGPSTPANEARAKRGEVVLFYCEPQGARPQLGCLACGTLWTKDFSGRAGHPG